MHGVVHDRAVGNIEKARAHLRRCGGLSKRRGSGHHGIQQRQRQAHSCPLQHRSAGNMFLGYEHVISLLFTDGDPGCGTPRY